MTAEILIYGIHSVERALKQDCNATCLYLQKSSKNQRLQKLEQLAQQLQLKIKRVAAEELDKFSAGERHQGCVLLLPETENHDAHLNMEGLLAHIEPSSLILILDGVTDPHNLGACLRSADATGVQAVIVPKDQAVGLTPVVRKVAAGAAETVPLIRVPNLARAIEALQKQGVWIYGLAGEAEQELYQCQLNGAVAMVMGAEGKGLRRLTREHCDELLKLPMLGQVESLNVSVATGVVLYEVLRQRSALP